MGSYHAVKSPSSSHRWGAPKGACTASIGAQHGIPNENTDASRYGTCGHQLVAECLTDQTLDAQDYLGRTMLFWYHSGSESAGEDWAEIVEQMCETEDLDITGTVVVDQPMIDACLSHMEYVLHEADLMGATLYVEQPVPIDHITGEAGATGTTDTALVYGHTLHVIDLKLGRMPVAAFDVIEHAQVDIITNELIPEVREPNSQLAMYASGTIRWLEFFHDIREVIITISQPFLNAVEQWYGTVEQLEHTIARLRRRAAECDTNPVFAPTPENCYFCRANGRCAAQDEAIAALALDGFDDVGEPQFKPVSLADQSLGTKYMMLPMLERWAAAVEKATWEKLKNREPVSRYDGLSYKLVLGRKGDRDWKNEDQAVAAMRSMRLNDGQIYKRTVVGPATIEALTKSKRAGKGEPKIPPVLGQTQWARLKELITQPEAKATIVLETDPRPAIAEAAEGFEDEAEAGNDSDLF